MIASIRQVHWLLGTIRHALGIDGYEQAEPASRLQSEDWRILIELTARTRTAPLLGCHIATADVPLPAWARTVFATAYSHSQRRNGELLEELERIAAALEAVEAGPISVRKGAYLCRLFPGIGARPFNDLDLLIAPDQANRVMEALAQLGYESGRRHANGREVVPLTKAQRIRYMVGTNAFPPILRVRESRYGSPKWFAVDIVRSLRPPQLGGGPDAALVSAGARPLVGTSICSLGEAELLLDVCVSLLLTNTALHYVWRHRYRRLTLYLDLLVIMSRFPSALAEALRVHGDHVGSRRALDFALGNLERLFPGAIIRLTGEAWSPSDRAGPDLLDAVGDLDGGTRFVWGHSLVDRTFEDVPLPPSLPSPPDLELGL